MTPIFAVGLAALALVVLAILFVWWRRFVLGRVSGWTASALMGFTLKPTAELEGQIRAQLARTLRVPVHLLRLQRTKGGVQMRVILCGKAVGMAPPQTVRVLQRGIVRYLPPWTDFGFEAAPNDPGFSPAPKGSP